MQEMVIASFTDTVRRIGKRPEKDKYTVHFRSKSAPFFVSRKNDETVDALSQSAKDESPMTIHYNPYNQEIISVQPL